MKRTVYLAFFLLLSIVYYHEAIFGGRLAAGADGSIQYYPYRVIASLIFGESPALLWNPYVFSGAPFAAAMTPGAFYPLNWPGLFLPDPLWFNLSAVVHLALAGFFTFLYVRLILKNDISALSAGIVFAFTGFVALKADHPAIMNSAIWLPSVMYCVEKLRLGAGRGYVFGLALALAMQTLAGYPMVFHTALVLLVTAPFYIYSVQKGKRASFCLKAALGTGLSLVLALPQIVSTMELQALSERAEMTMRFFGSFSWPPFMLPALFIPFFWGRGYAGPYWGPFNDLTIHEGYIGVAALILALTGAMGAFKSNKNGSLHVKAMTAVAIMAIILSFGKYLPFFEILWKTPFFNLFRGHSKHWYEAGFALSVLMAYGITLVTDKKAKTGIAVPLALTLSAITASVLAFGVFRDPLGSYISGRYSLIRGNLLSDALSLTSATVYVPIILLVLTLVWLVAARRGGKWAVAALVLLLFADALTYKTEISGGWPEKEPLKTACQSGLYKYLGGKQDGRTVFLHEKLPPMHGAMCGLYMAEGYEPLFISRYGKLLKLDNRGVYAEPQFLLKDARLLSLLSVKYIVASNRQKPMFKGLPFYRELYRDQKRGAIVYLNRNALPFAYPVESLFAMNNSEPEPMRFFSRNNINPFKTAVVSAEDFSALGPGPYFKGTVDIKEKTAGKIVLETEFPADGFVVISEQHYPGWKAYIDNRAARLYRTNSVLSGMEVPAGLHTITYIYRPYHIYASMAVSLLTFLSGCYLVLSRKRKRTEG